MRSEATSVSWFMYGIVSKTGCHGRRVLMCFKSGPLFAFWKRLVVKNTCPALLLLMSLCKSYSRSAKS